MTTLYVLQLEYGKWYIGKTDNIKKRYEQHKTGRGSAWTSKFPPVKLVECRPLKDEFDEDNTTRQYMKKYGISNVRGGSHTRLELSDGEEEVLLRQIRSSDDLCFNCGQRGHFCRNCPEKNQEEMLSVKCERCELTGHYAHLCHRYLSASGKYLGVPPVDPTNFDAYDSDSD
jgi:predicted GIY-YIG superfamily endonuclease